MTLTEGQTSDYSGARLMLAHLPPAREMLADRGYDADWLRKELAERGIAACIPSRAKRKSPVRTTPPSTSSATRSRSCSAG